MHARDVSTVEPLAAKHGSHDLFVGAEPDAVFVIRCIGETQASVAIVFVRRQRALTVGVGLAPINDAVAACHASRKVAGAVAVHWRVAKVAEGH